MKLKSTTLCNALATIVLISAPPTLHAANFYAGASFGQSTWDDIETSESDIDDGSIISMDSEDSDTGLRLFIGAEINPNLSVELGHVDLGEFTIDAISDGSGVLYAPGDVSAKASGDGMDLSLIGKFPVGSRGSLYVRAGMLMWDVDAKLSDSTGSISGSDDGSDIFYAFGGEYRIADNFGLRGEYALYTLDEDDVNLLSLSLIYHTN